ncbi:MAG: tetratricopeptide repeat protein [Bacteroidetes bacterium]|nr:tetratricopeptide repeat protein [Bacteroidota bacterium]
MQKVTLPILLSILLASTTCFGQTKAIDSLQRIIALQKHDTTEINAMAGLSFEFLRKDLSKTKSYAHQTIKLARSLNAASQLGNGYFYLVTSHQNSGTLDSALYYLDLLGKLSEAHPSKWKMAANYNQAAGLFYKNTGQPKKALSYMIKNLILMKTESESKAGLLLNIGNIHYDLVEYKNSSEYYLQSLRMFEKNGSKRGESYCLQSLGNTFMLLKQYDASKKYFERALKLKKEQNDTRGMISSTMGLGDVNKELGQHVTSEQLYLQALKLAREIKIPAEEGRGLYQLGLLYKRMGDVDKAREHMSQALLLTRQIGDSLTSAKIKSEMIGIDLKVQQELQTEQTLLNNLNTMIALGDKNTEALEYGRLSDYYAIRKQFDKAYFYQKKYEALTDSVKGNAMVLQLKELEGKYNSEKNEREIAILKKDQELQTLALSKQRANTTIIVIILFSVLIIGGLLINRYRVMNRTKRLLEIETVRNNIARDLHDDMGSALSSINILSQVALVEKNGNTQSYLQRIGEQSARMMEDMSDMVWSINPRNDSMTQVLIRMREFASEIFELKNIDYQFIENDIEHLKLNAEQRKNLFLIFKEAINNAAKYSGANRVEIGLQQRGHVLEMAVSDHGHGFDEQAIKAGNGLRNMRERAKEIKGTLELRSAVGKGTEIILTLPIA